MAQTLKIFIPLCIIFALLIATNFIYAAWTAPSGTPSELNNAYAPINVSGTSQLKTGGLTTGALSVIGNQALTGGAPSIKFNDSTAGHGDYWTHVNNGRFYFLNDVDSNGSWESPYPLVLDGPNNYAQFENQVRAVSYCDYSGGNCTTPAQISSVASGPTAINTSATAQTKIGGLTTGALSVIGDASISEATPAIKFNDTSSGAGDYWAYANSGYFFILNDADDNGSYDSAPHPLTISGLGNWARFENQVRAATYCDYNGGNCTTPAQINSATAPETDPQVGTLFNGGWCRSNGSSVICDQFPPTSDPWNCRSDVYLYTEAVVYTDSNRPWGCANGLQDSTCMLRACTERGYTGRYGSALFIDMNPGPWSQHQNCYKWEPIVLCGYY